MYLDGELSVLWTFVDSVLSLHCCWHYVLSAGMLHLDEDLIFIKKVSHL